MHNDAEIVQVCRELETDNLETKFIFNHNGNICLYTEDRVRQELLDNPDYRKEIKEIIINKFGKNILNYIDNSNDI